ncbi:hypothetical protein ACN38_g9436 [Penicillium nordicum]|uniref:Uncharacterized protein n=1 Tax=Penicillium nordicum TaxID=229535 RepID=A0A0M9WCV8_9EURO|nr:hypothetical protein ACN38_g9436 [Penicillium nordicum]
MTMIRSGRWYLLSDEIEPTSYSRDKMAPVQKRGRRGVANPSKHAELQLLVTCKQCKRQFLQLHLGRAGRSINNCLRVGTLYDNPFVICHKMHCIHRN